MSKNSSSRFPTLGKLSVAILENLVEPILGKNAIAEIKAPLAERELLETLSKALENTEKRFVTEHTEITIREAILGLPLATMPNVVQAVRIYFSKPTDPILARTLSGQLIADYPHLPPEQIKTGVSIYLRILREELVNISHEAREKLSALATLNIHNNSVRMANTLEKILEHLIAEKTAEQIVKPPINEKPTLIGEVIQEKQEMATFQLFIQTTGIDYTIKFPLDASVKYIIPEIVRRLKLPEKLENGWPVAYRLFSQSSRRVLQDDLTLRQNGVQDGDLLSIHIATSIG